MPFKLSFLSPTTTTFRLFIAALLFLFVGFSTLTPAIASKTKVVQKEDFKVRINSGRKATNKRDIEVEVRPARGKAATVSQMKISMSSNLSSKKWQSFSSKITVKLTGSEGVKSIFVQLKDKAGNLSSVVETQILYDVTPPSNGSVQINEGKELTNTRLGKVRLQINANEAKIMQISNDSGFQNTKWIPYAESMTWLFANKNDGQKTVYARFMDVATNISEVVKTTIILDKTAPKSSIVINDGDKYTNKRDVKLVIKAADAVQLRIAGPGVKSFDYKTDDGLDHMTVNWTLDSTQGKKTVKLFARDKAGNVSEQAVYDQIILDSEGPAIRRFAINKGKKYTTNKEGIVNLDLISNGTPEYTKMQISNTSDFHDAKERKYSTKVLKWKLDAEEDGLKTVYLKLNDQAGNGSKVVSAQVYLDRLAPVAKSLLVNSGNKLTTASTVSLVIDAEDAQEMQISNQERFTSRSEWRPYEPAYPAWKLTQVDGVQNIFIRFKDKAGNISQPISGKVIKDTKAPVGKLSLNGNSRYTNNQEKKINIALSYKGDAHEMKIDNDEDLSDVAWEVVSKEKNNWQLLGSDGEKIIYAVFKDEAGNVSKPIRKRIILDREAPTGGSISINSDSAFTNSPEKLVRLSLYAQGVSAMMIAQNSHFDEARWEKYSKERNLTLNGGDGVKNIYVKYKDPAGNVSEAVSATITLKRYPPKPVGFLINNGDKWTNSKEKKVDLKIKAAGADLMKISDDPNFANATWQPYATEVMGYSLIGNDGEKRLYVMFKDNSGQESESISASINLKRDF